jgi:hypothetical protein
MCEISAAAAFASLFVSSSAGRARARLSISSSERSDSHISDSLPLVLSTRRTEALITGDAARRYGGVVRTPLPVMLEPPETVIVDDVSR